MRLTILFLCFFCTALFADEVTLSDGRVLEGKVEDLGNEIRITRGKSAVTFPKSMVKRIRYKATKEEEYAERVKRLDDKDPEAHFDLGRWCVDNGLKDEAAVQFRKTIELEPDHAGAREALGYKKIDGMWMTEDEINAAKGLVKYKGRWVTPEERDMAEETEKSKEAEQEMYRKVRKAVADLATSNEKRQQEAIATLNAIGWEYKLKIFITGCSSFSVRVRRYVSEQLGEANDKSAVPALTRVWLFDSDETARKNAEAAIYKLGSPDVVFLHLLKALFADRRDVIGRAIVALREFKDLRSVEFLLDLLQADMEVLGQVSSPGNERMLGKRLMMPDGTEAVVPEKVLFHPTPEEFEARKKQDEAAKAEALKARIKKEQKPVEEYNRDSMQDMNELLKTMEKEAVEQEKKEIVATLRGITGQDYGVDLAAWRKWLAEQGKKDKKPGPEKKE
jgi:hypothetical protein